jgi:hypothetical protein
MAKEAVAGAVFLKAVKIVGLVLLLLLDAPLASLGLSLNKGELATGFLDTIAQARFQCMLS